MAGKRRDGAAVAWLKIGNDDNNEWFLSHLLESIRRVRTLAESLGHVLENMGTPAATC